MLMMHIAGTIAWCAVMAAAEGPAGPVLRVPLAPRAVAIDGHIGRAEWEGAAVVRRLWLPGNATALPVPTELLLQYDPANLYLAARCTESEQGYPKAFPRQPTDLLNDDDAVQVVLGTADSFAVARDVLQMGGYANAQGQPVSSADHYYQFTANAVGARARTYNESPLERPLFDAEVSRNERGWSVEMRVPFASAGIGDPSGQPMFVNLFRFRPPEMAGWHLPAFGGYAPMPFGELVLLPRGSEAERTAEEALPPRTRVDKPRDPQARLDWYPLSHRVVAELQTGGASRAMLRVAGVGERHAMLCAGVAARLIVDVPPEASLPCEAEVVMRGADGRVVAQATRELAAAERPEWLGTRAGADYLRDRVPQPWTYPEVVGHTIRLRAGNMTFGPNGLFASVTRAGGELLAGPGEIVLQTDRGPVSLRPLELNVKSHGSAATAEAMLSAAGGRVDLRSEVDYDGFTATKLRVRGIAPERIAKLTVRFPLRRESARFVLRQLVQDVRPLTGFGWEGPAGPVWLGGHDRGLAFAYDTPLFLSAHRRSQVQVVEEADRTWLCLNLVDAPGQVTDQGHVFRFFLTPTPTKPVSLRKDGLFHTALWFENWSDYQGYPDLAKLPEVRRRSDEAHARGVPQVLYFSQVLAENSPGFAECRSEFLVPPGMAWYRRAYDPGRDVPCWVSCPRGPFGDRLLDGMERLAAQGGIDGVYMDGLSVPWDCTNPAHAACAQPITPMWDRDELTPLVATRAFLKRVRGIFDQRGHPRLFAHTGGAINIETLSLCDGYYEGEQLARYRPGFRLPLHQAAVGYCGRPWGFRTDAIPVAYGTRRLMALAALHDTEVGGDGTELERCMYTDFQSDAAVDYRPYWRTQPHVRPVAGNVIYSYYRKPGAALLVVSNLTWDTQQAELDVSGLFAGRPIHAIDLDRRVPVAVAGSRLGLSLKPHRFAAIRLEPGAGEEAAPPFRRPNRPAVHIAEYRDADWDLHPNASGVEISASCDLGAGRRGPQLTSTVYHDYATATLNAFPLSEGGTVRLWLRHSGRLQLDLGRPLLQFDGSTWSIVEDPWREGHVYSIVTSGHVARELDVAVRGGYLDVVFGGQALARHVPVPEGVGAALLDVKTWGGDSLAFDVIEISTEPMNLFEPQVDHPVR